MRAEAYAAGSIRFALFQKMHVLTNKAGQHMPFSVVDTLVPSACLRGMRHGHKQLDAVEQIGL